MLILSVCNNSGVLGAIYVLKLIMLGISYLAPVILIVILMIHLTKAIIGDTEKKIDYKTIVNKITIAIAIFVFPTMISLILSLVGGSLEYQNCLEMATLDNVKMYQSIEAQERANRQGSGITTPNGETPGVSEPDTPTNPGSVDVGTNEYGNVSSMSLSGVSCKVYYGETVLPSMMANTKIHSQMTQILNNICSYISRTSYVNRLETAGMYNPGGTHQYPHAYGLGIDLFNNWKYTENGTTYAPYQGQGTNTWVSYNKFICEVCDGKENCSQNINYHIYNNYFKPAGYCWGGNWGKGSFDPMHYELSKDGSCSTSNKSQISC